MAKFAAASSSGSQAIFNFLISSPFYPNLTPSGEQSKLEFNAGYIFDYNNFDTLREPIEVEQPPEEELPEGQDTFILEKTGDKTFHILLEIYKTSGKIKKATFKEGEPPDYSETGPFKFPMSTDRSSDNGVNGPIFKDRKDSTLELGIILAKFKGQILEELYLRENIHLNLLAIRSFGQANANSEGADGEVTFPLIKLDDTEGNTADDANEDNPSPNNFHLKNGPLSLIGLSTIDTMDNNILVIEYDDQAGLIRLGVDEADIEHPE